jgi:DNA-binding transcriptional regulator GbsR (MarR family)
MKAITLQDLQQLHRLAEELLQLGEQLAKQLEGSLDSAEFINLFNKRQNVFQQFSDFLNIDLDAVRARAEDESLRNAAVALQTILGKVVEQNTQLTQAIERHKSQLHQHMTNIDHALQLVQKYFPLSQDHGLGTRFDSQG